MISTVSNLSTLAGRGRLEMKHTRIVCAMLFSVHGSFQGVW